MKLRLALCLFCAIPLGALPLLSLSCKSNEASNAEPTPSAPPPTATPDGGTAADASEAVLPSAAPFEGTLTLSVSHAKGPPTELTLTAKARRVRVDVPDVHGHPAYSIFDPTTQQLVLVADADQTVTSLTPPTAPDAGTASTATKTSLKETVLDRPCEDWSEFDAKGAHLTVCATAGLVIGDVNAILPAVAGAPTFGPWTAELDQKNYFPLIALAVSKKGALEARIDVTKIDPHPVADSIFAIPAVYHRVVGADASRRR